MRAAINTEDSSATGPYAQPLRMYRALLSLILVGMLLAKDVPELIIRRCSNYIISVMFRGPSPGALARPNTSKGPKKPPTFLDEA